jgi:hypothetical protein
VDRLLANLDIVCMIWHSLGYVYPHIACFPAEERWEESPILVVFCPNVPVFFFYATMRPRLSALHITGHVGYAHSEETNGRDV